MGVVDLFAVVVEEEAEVFFHGEVFYSSLIAVGGAVFSGFRQVCVCPGRGCFVCSFGKEVQLREYAVIYAAYQREILAMGGSDGGFCLCGYFRQDTQFINFFDGEETVDVHVEIASAPGSCDNPVVNVVFLTFVE